MNLSNVSQIRINGSEVALMKLNGAILYENNRIPLYKVGMFRDSDITEAKTIVNTSHTDLSYMFSNCAYLTSVNTTDWDTSNVTDMERMFDKCFSLTELDLSSFDTYKVTTMQAMFFYCRKLTSLDLSNFDTSNVTDMQSMFSYCTNLTSLNLSNFDMTSVTNMSNMFNYCSYLDTLRLDNCSYDTIYKIITSEVLPVSTVIKTRTIHCKEENAPDASLLPSNWQFEYID